MAGTKYCCYCAVSLDDLYLGPIAQLSVSAASPGERLSFGVYSNGVRAEIAARERANFFMCIRRTDKQLDFPIDTSPVGARRTLGLWLQRHNAYRMG